MKNSAGHYTILYLGCHFFLISILGIPIFIWASIMLYFDGDFSDENKNYHFECSYTFWRLVLLCVCVIMLFSLIGQLFHLYF